MAFPIVYTADTRNARVNIARLRKYVGRLTGTVNASETAMRRAFGNLSTLLGPVGVAIRALTGDMRDLTRQLDAAERASRGLRRNLRRARPPPGAGGGGFGGVGSGLGALAGGAFGFLALRELGQLSNEYLELQNRLRLVTRGTEDLHATTRKLFEVANESRTAFRSTAIVYSRVALSAKALGIEQTKLLKFTENLQKATIVSGATTQEALFATIQLSQGIASDRLGGDELRSVLEQLPFVAQLLADKLGVARGELRKLGSEGKLTGKLVVDAIASSSERVEAAFKLTIPTLSQAWTVLTNQIQRYTGEVDAATSTTRVLAKVLKFVGENLDDFVSGIALLATIITGALFLKTIVSIGTNLWNIGKAIKYISTLNLGNILELAKNPKLWAAAAVGIAGALVAFEKFEGFFEQFKLIDATSVNFDLAAHGLPQFEQGIKISQGERDAILADAYELDRKAGYLVGEGEPYVRARAKARLQHPEKFENYEAIRRFIQAENDKNTTEEEAKLNAELAAAAAANTPEARLAKVVAEIEARRRQTSLDRLRRGQFAFPGANLHRVMSGIDTDYNLRRRRELAADEKAREWRIYETTRESNLRLQEKDRFFGPDKYDEHGNLMTGKSLMRPGYNFGMIEEDGSRQQKALEKYQKKLEEMGSVKPWEQIKTTIGTGWSNAINVAAQSLSNMIATGKSGFRDLANTLLRELGTALIRLGIQGLVGGPAADGSGGGVIYNAIFGGNKQHGGRFRLRGTPGMDRNLVAFGMTHNEEIDFIPTGRAGESPQYTATNDNMAPIQNVIKIGVEDIEGLFDDPRIIRKMDRRIERSRRVV